MTAFSPAAITVPDDLAEYDSWVVWRYETRDGKPTKVPYQVSGRRADSTDPGTWTTYENALAAFEQQPERFAGIGFVFSAADPFAGVDLDNCINDAGSLAPWASRIVERFADTHIEVSPSGQGLKIFCRGSLPRNVAKVPVGDGGIELYDHKRFFTVTGNIFGNGPMEIEDHSSDLLVLFENLQPSRKTWAIQPAPSGKIPMGKRHDFLVSLCGTLRVRGVCEEAILACLEAVNRFQCEAPHDREHVAKIITTSRAWGQR